MINLVGLYVNIVLGFGINYEIAFVIVDIVYEEQ